jgi:hypothetical protein
MVMVAIIATPPVSVYRMSWSSKPRPCGLGAFPDIDMLFSSLCLYRKTRVRVVEVVQLGPEPRTLSRA